MSDALKISIVMKDNQNSVIHMYWQFNEHFVQKNFTCQKQSIDFIEDNKHKLKKEAINLDAGKLTHLAGNPLSDLCRVHLLASAVWIEDPEKFLQKHRIK